MKISNPRNKQLKPDRFYYRTIIIVRQRFFHILLISPYILLKYFFQPTELVSEPI